MSGPMMQHSAPLGRRLAETEAEIVRLEPVYVTYMQIIGGRDPNPRLSAGSWADVNARMDAALGETRSRMDAAVAQAMARICAAEEREIKRMLGEWVSEMEPILVRGPWGDHQNVLLGLSYADAFGNHAAGASVVVPARPVVLEIRR